MFPVDTLSTAYCEDRAAADEAKRLAQLQHATALKHAQAAMAAQSASSTQRSKTFQEQSRLNPNTNTGLLGNLMQGFLRSGSSSAASSRCPTPLSSPRQEISAAKISEEMDKLIAERKRDADICAMPTW